MKNKFLKPIIFLMITLSAINFNCSKDGVGKEDQKEDPEKNDKGFINFKVDGQQYTTDGASLFRASSTSRSQVTGTASSNDEPRLIITFEGASEGSYDWGLLCGSTTGKANISFVIPNIKTYSPCYTLDCTTGESVTSSGNLNVTNFGDTEGFAEGTFTVTVYYKECSGQLDTKQITGSFKARRKN